MHFNIEEEYQSYLKANNLKEKDMTEKERAQLNDAFCAGMYGLMITLHILVDLEPKKSFEEFRNIMDQLRIYADSKCINYKLNNHD